MEKEYLYVGHYRDINDRYILKIGTTNNLERRKKEHERNYKRTSENKMPANGSFVYDWFLKLSKYNTLRYEDKNRLAWQESQIGEYIRNDRFFCTVKPTEVQVKIRKVYTIPL